MRKSGYRDWLAAFPRELFQNSTDAGASRVAITLTAEAGRSNFGDASNASGKVVRVVFADDGSGISEKTFRNVFFNLGQTTKNASADDGAVGGFGTARLMLCFSQDSYRITSGNMYVRGRGELYEIMTLADARAVLKAEAASDDAAVARAAAAELMELAPEPVKGTIFSIDVPMADVDGLGAVEDSFRSYISRSQMASTVTINGDPVRQEALRRRARKELFANIDGKDVPFAKVHTNASPQAAHAGEVLVRVSGALMYSRRAYGVDEQVIVEIYPKLSRKVLTQDRENLIAAADERLYSFMSGLREDKEAALRETERKKLSITPGGKGPVKTDEKLDFTFASAVEIDESHIPEDSEIPDVVRRGFVRQVSEGLPSFLDGFPARTEVDDFLKDCRENGWDALTRTPDNLRVYIMRGLGRTTQEYRVALAEEADRAEPDRPKGRLAEMHDIHIMADDIAGDDRLKVSVRQYSPDYWVMLGDPRRAPRGRGMEAHKLLMAWTVCCQTAFRALSHVAARPENQARFGSKLAKLADGTEFGTGFYFTRARTAWADGEMRPVATVVSNSHLDEAGKPLMLLNPVGTDTKIAYDISKSSAREARGHLDGLAELENLAVSDVCHLVTGGYNQEFAELFMRALALFNRDENRAAIASGSESVMAAYGKGNALTQRLDAAPAADDMPRPAERLLALAAPAVTALAGLAVENPAQVGPELAEVLDTVLPPSIDGARDVDCEALQQVENGLQQLASAGWSPEARPPAPVPAESAEATVEGDAPMATEDFAQFDVLDDNTLAIIQGIDEHELFAEDPVTRARDNLRHTEETIIPRAGTANPDDFLSLDDAMSESDAQIERMAISRTEDDEAEPDVSEEDDLPPLDQKEDYTAVNLSDDDIAMMQNLSLDVDFDGGLDDFLVPAPEQETKASAEVFVEEIIDPSLGLDVPHVQKGTDSPVPAPVVMEDVTKGRPAVIAKAAEQPEADPRAEDTDTFDISHFRI